MRMQSKEVRKEKNTWLIIFFLYGVHLFVIYSHLIICGGGHEDSWCGGSVFAFFCNVYYMCVCACVGERGANTERGSMKWVILPYGEEGKQECRVLYFLSLTLLLFSSFSFISNFYYCFRNLFQRLFNF